MENLNGIWVEFLGISWGIYWNLGFLRESESNLKEFGLGKSGRNLRESGGSGEIRERNQAGISTNLEWESEEESEWESTGI